MFLFTSIKKMASFRVAISLKEAFKLSSVPEDAIKILEEIIISALFDKDESIREDRVRILRLKASNTRVAISKVFMGIIKYL